MKRNIRKKILIWGFLVATLTAFSENVVDVDLEADTMVSTEGVEANYGDIQMNVFKAKRDRDKGIVYLESPFTARLRDPNNRGYLKADSGHMTTDGKNGEFDNAFGYLEVGNATNAEYPNDKIYYGGKKIMYSNGNVLMRDGWFTTDPKIRKVENNDPNKVGYHLISDTTYIEPDKQITFKDIDFYKGDKSYLPFEFPWLRANIRPTSLVPLFPSYVTGDDDYGFAATWGALWGNKDDKYKGGFAPKFSDKQGWLVGRMENWYETDDYGQFKWNMNDTQIKKKDDDVDRRFQNEFIHNYSGEYGTNNLNLTSGTNNLIPSLDDIMDDYKERNFWNKKGLKGKEVKETDRVEFFAMDSELKGMGKEKDISFTSNVKQVSDKDAYDLQLYDAFDDDGMLSPIVSEKGTTETSLYSQFALYKDNDRYKIGGYYNYLREMAPGYTSLDRSRDESFGFEIFDKRNKLHATYDKSTRDKYRPLTFMEQHEDIDATLFTNRGQELSSSITGMYGDYGISSIPEYKKYNSEKFNFTAGDYSLGDFTSTSGYSMKKIENELSLQDDPTRDSIKGNRRDNQYNRYNNIIFEERRESRGWTDLENKDFGFTLGGGREKVEIWDREGIYDDDTYSFHDLKEGSSYKKYEYETEFVDYKVEKKPFDIGVLGKFGAYAGGRYDQYTDQYVTGESDEDLADNSTRTNLGFSHEKELFNSGDNELSNKFGYDYQNYNEENILLNHSENFNKFNDTVSFGTSTVGGEYKVNYDMIDNAATGDKKNRVFNNSLGFEFAPEHKLDFSYGSNERYTDDNEPEENKNDLTFRNYGVKYQYKKHAFSYKREEIDYDIWQIEDTDDSTEDIDIDTFKYAYEFDNRDKISLGYIIGSDKRDNETTGDTEIDTKKRSYNVSYMDYGPRYDNTYTARYGRNRYNEDVLNSYSTDTYGFGYEFLDKSMDPEFLKTYALKEYDKDEEHLTSEDLDKAASLLKERKQQNKEGLSKFGYFENWKRPQAFTGDYNRKFSFNVNAEKNKEKYDQTNDFMDSLEDVGFNVGYSERRIGVGFGYSKEINNKNAWINENGDKDEDEEYTAMLNMKVGKPSEGYRVTLYSKWEKESFYDDNGNPDGSDTANDMGVELGKEMGYYEWSIAYFTEYDYGERDNDWQIALQFALLTFPDIPIFGIGASQDAGKKHTNPESSFMSGLKASDVDLDD